MERSLSEDNLSTGYSNSSYCRVSLSRNTLGGVLSTPVPPNKLPTKRLKSCGQVLTAAEFLQKMEEAEESKKVKAREKEERKLKNNGKANKRTKGAKKSLIPGTTI